MPENLYPQRLRCKACRKKLGTTVLDGLFCSYRCAHIPQPSAKIAEAPRYCKREVNGAWGWKTKYRADNEVPEKLRNDPATNIYVCDYCHFKHVGHSRISTELLEKLRRTVQDVETLGSVIKRVRESQNIEKKLLAKILKIPTIRITEIESGSPNSDIQVLFAILRRLNIKVELIQQ